MGIRERNKINKPVALLRCSIRFNYYTVIVIHSCVCGVLMKTYMNSHLFCKKNYANCLNWAIRKTTLHNCEKINIRQFSLKQVVQG